MMRCTFMMLMLLLSASQLLAQQKSPEYFAPVPTRFHKPGLSPMQSVRFGLMSTPGNEWLKHSGELKLDLFRIRMSMRFSALVSGSVWAGYKRERKDLYTVRDEEAFERTNYFFAAPGMSAGVSWGFFFPYYLNARFGIYKPWEGAYYKAYLPVQYSDQQDIQTRETEVVYSRQGIGEVQKYLGLELYRPFRSRFPDRHPMGWSVSYTHFLDLEGGQTGGWNIGLYWHVKAK